MIFNLRELQLLKKNNCATLFLNLCINIEVMAQTSSKYDYFIIWPSSVTLTLNLPEQMLRFALLRVRENKCAELFWNPIWMHKCRSYVPNKLNLLPLYHLTIKCDLQLTRTNISKGTATHQNNCAKLFWNPGINVKVMIRTNLDERTHARRYARIYTEQKL